MYPDDSLGLHTDLYEINMMYVYFKEGIHNKRAVFEAYFRSMPFGNGFAVTAGLKHAIEYLQELHFSVSDIEYLRQTGEYDEDFLQYLSDFKFDGTVNAIEEGELVYANEPFFQFVGPLATGQLIETAILNIINYQILIATKASRFRLIAPHDTLLEFGSRRAPEMDAAIWGARATYIGGFDGTSNVRSAKIFGIPASGTHAHALVQTYKDDYTAFKKYAEHHHDVVFLVDTYDTIESGVPAAIKVAKEMGDKINFVGVRIDSGDIAYISKQVRKQLDDAGFKNTKIIASNDLDELTILNLKMQHAKIDTWGVGTKLITAYDQPALGGVYKLVGIEDDHGKMEDTMKLSSNVEKVSVPGQKQIWRITDAKTEKSEGDYIASVDEHPDQQSELFMFHPKYIYVNKTLKNFKARPILKQIFEKGKLVYESPAADEIKAKFENSLSSLWDEYKRLLNPQDYPVDLSKELWDKRMNGIKNVRKVVSEKKNEK